MADSPSPVHNHICHYVAFIITTFIMYNVHSRQRNRRAAVPSSPGGGVRLFGGACSYTVLEFDPLLDSSSMTPKDWETIAATVEKHYYDYDGFVVIHGTDTMAYVKSLSNRRETLL